MDNFDFAGTFNVEAKKFDVNTEGFEYFNLQDLYENNGEDQEYPVTCFYINKKGKFGDAPVIGTDEYFVNLPQHLLESVLKIIDNPKAVEAVNAGKVAFKIYSYKDEKHNKICYSIKYINK